VKLSLDDFGTGHSSLSYLKRLPLDEVKIDRSFVMGMTDDDNDAAIVRTTIDLARNLGLDVVAEGVEDEATLADLGALRCDVAQGFHLSRPLPAGQLEAWLAARGPEPITR
jgi:EAL domain-containing protein (putative c-di-GMP-specific phosphodiesterase class I)